MSVEQIAIILTIVIFITVMIIASIERLDYVGYAIIAAVISCIITSLLIFKDPNLGERYNIDDFISQIEFDVIFFVICMQIVVALAEKFNLFQWLVLKALRLTKGDHRKFFYLICTVSSFSAAIISDITIAIIFVPLVIRACKILNIKAAPYIFGISFTINIGSIYTPFSSSENILISDSFGLNFSWFLSYFTLFIIPVLILTLVVLDFWMLKKIEPPTERQKRILLEIMNPEIVIVERKQFILNGVYFLTVIGGFIFFSAWALIIAIVGAVVICLLNKISFHEMVSLVDWKTISFFIGIFLLVGTMNMNGTFEIIGNLAKNIIGGNQYISAIIVLFLISILSGFLAQIPTALVFISLLENIYGSIPEIPDIVIVALLLGINIGSNFLPQGAACDLIALNLAEKNKVEGFNYRSLLINGSKITIFHLINSVIYITILSAILGLF